MKTVMSAAAPTTTPTIELTDLDDLMDDVWKVVVVNDDINTFDHVIRAFCEVLGYEVEASAKKAMEIHVTGRGDVWVGTREECVHKAQILRDGYKLDARAVGGEEE